MNKKGGYLEKNQVAETVHVPRELQAQTAAHLILMFVNVKKKKKKVLCYDLFWFSDDILIGI